ncbi:MAG: group II intron reverse transcriptase/maturase [Methylocystis silviterrae]|uniref:group II intron reverse transcriptase/maturase n=1 Tax=Methylocystis silviterrae TaxID=2743612 RepID=UPI003C7110FA
MDEAKPFCISKREVWMAYKRVKENRGAAGVDDQTIAEFEKDLNDNLYRLWNRMSSGSYMPPPVRRVDIPKSDGGTRPLGIPTVSDRIAQMVVKRYLEPSVEPVFHADSYGYRPGRSAHDALAAARQRCWRHDWVLDLDIKGFFDNIDWELLMRAVRRHTDCAWVLLYIERWLKAPVSMPDGALVSREKGTPQGAVVSPLLANLFLHYAFDRWMKENHSNIPFERYADDVICHCGSEAQALSLRQALEARLAACKLELHPQKTKIVYCKDANRRDSHSEQRFDFLGFTFRPRQSMNRAGRLFVSFSPAISDKAAKAMRETVRRWKLHHRTDLALEKIAQWTRPMVLGWVHYYGRFHRSALRRALRTLDSFIERWAQRKYKRLRGHTKRAWDWLRGVQSRQPDLFAHWSRESQVGR